ncbi:hypothetical protein GCM10022200_05570 [Microbacterium awajiense]|uniref:Uncharacterized protein n=1 Tax=Microbacterium awajiense TaxID=415214 RepID=A0ABP7A6T5_9MICO
MATITEPAIVTVADIADALGIPGQVAAVHEGLVADGLTITEDWAGRPAVSFRDAKRTIDRHRKQQAEWEARRTRDMMLNDEAAKCQTEFDEIAGRALPVLRRADPLSTDPDSDRERMVEARRIALEAVQGKYSPEAIARLLLKPIMTIEDDTTAAFRPIEIVESTDAAVEKIKNPKSRARLLAYLFPEGRP